MDELKDLRSSYDEMAHQLEFAIAEAHDIRGFHGDSDREAAKLIYNDLLATGKLDTQTSRLAKHRIWHPAKPRRKVTLGRELKFALSKCNPSN